MRYFKTSNASRPYKVPGFAFTFEPTAQVGGVWSGVLAVADEAAAKTLANAQFPQVTEITAEEFDEVKKKPLQRLSSSVPLSVPRSEPRPPAPSPAPVAPPVAQPVSPQSESAKPAVRSGKVNPPDELGLVTDKK